MLSETSEGVAANSLRIHGMAIDVCVAGATIERNWQWIVKLGMGRDGLYCRSNFIHLNAGMVQSWGE